MAIEATLHELPSIGVSWIVKEKMERASHAITDECGGVWLIDPVDWSAGIEAAIHLGEPVGVVQLLDRHNRDGKDVATALGVPFYRLCDGPATPMPPRFSFTPIPVISRRGWREVGLWDAKRELLVIAESIGTSSYFAVGSGRAGVSPLARLRRPRSFERLRSLVPEVLLVGHGPPLASSAAHDLHVAIDCARSDLPRLVMKGPSLLFSKK